jgi:hypothetical protein
MVEERRTYQNRILLSRFWEIVVGRDHATRLAILRGYARTELAPDPHIRYSPAWMRAHYRDRRARGFWQSLGQCWLCEHATAKHRHHILPIENGGRNIKKNIVPLCVACHRSVHAAPRTTGQIAV